MRCRSRFAVLRRVSRSRGDGGGCQGLCAATVTSCYESDGLSPIGDTRSYRSQGSARSGAISYRVNARDTVAALTLPSSASAASAVMTT
jgi:hypothetical protein